MLVYKCFNSLPNNKILEWSNLKAVADNKVNAIEKLKFVLGWVKNIVGIRRKCWFPARSPFPTMFSKGIFLRVVKSWDCVVKSYIWTRLKFRHLLHSDGLRCQDKTYMLMGMSMALKKIHCPG